MLLDALGPERLQSAELMIYVRRQDLLLEAMAKQKLKSGHYKGDLEKFISARKHVGNYMSYISNVRNRYPDLAITCRPYDKRELVDKDVIADFWQFLDLPEAPQPAPDTGSANMTPCRELAIALSQREFATPQHRRRVIADIQHTRPDMFKSRDILDESARRALLEEFREENRALGSFCGRDLEKLFNDDVDCAAESNPIENPAERDALIKAVENTVQEVAQRLHPNAPHKKAPDGGTPDNVGAEEEGPPKIIAEYKGLKVPDSPYARRTGGSRFRDGKYERKEREIGEALLKDGDRILELGAGLGFVGGYLAFSRPSVELWSFEANPNLVPHVERTYAVNEISDRAHVSNQVVLTGKDLPASAQFHIYNCYLGSSLFDREDKPRPSVEDPTIS